MKVTVRQLEGEEMLDALYTLGMYALMPSPPFRDKQEWLSFARERQGVTCFAAFEDNLPVSIAASTAMTQNLRGKLFPAGGVWGVSTAPGARRKGYCRQTVVSLLQAERESGKVFSSLYPFRESFYQRLGFVTYPLTKTVKFSPANLLPALDMDPGGEIELRLVGDAYETYRAYLAEMRQQTHGMGFFNIGTPASAARANLWLALARFDGQPEGLMLYKLTGEDVTKYNFTVTHFYTMTSRARYQLLNWIARHIDQAGQVEMRLPPAELPETWLADMQIKTESAVRAAMGRVLDVAKIGGMSVGPGRFAAKISDPHCPWNEGLWQFESREGVLHVSPVPAADCELTIQGLSALVAGTHDPRDFGLRGWGDPDAALQANLRRMFPPLSPFLHENF